MNHKYFGKREKDGVKVYLWPIVVCSVLIFALVVKMPIFVNRNLRCMEYLVDECTTSDVDVDVFIHGVYWKSVRGDDVFNGTIRITNGLHNKSGRLKNIPFCHVFNGYTAGQLFIYNPTTERHEALGKMFWDISRQSFMIQTSDTLIFYPANGVAGLNQQLEMLNMEPVK